MTKLIQKIFSSSTSDSNLFSFLSEIKKHNCKVKLLRFAAPRELRYEIISIINPNIKSTGQNNLIELLKQSNLKSIKILMINPFCNDYLYKLDAEKKSIEEIIRIKEEIFQFIKGLCFFKLKENVNIKFGLYSSRPIWNMAVIQNSSEISILLKSYGLKSQIKGHNESGSAEVSFKTDGKTFIAESFVNFFKSIEINKSLSHWFYDQNDFEDFKNSNKWPSLFKMNSIICEKKGENKKPTYVSKVFGDSKGYEAELACYRLPSIEGGGDEYFRPLKLYRQPFKEYDWIGKAICLQHIHGITYFQLATKLHQFDEKDEKRSEKILFILGLTVHNTLQALYKFRELIENRMELKCYPYAEKLKNAFEETKPFFNFNGNHWDGIQTDIEKLTNKLQNNCTSPFRDAHLKNRLLKTDADSLDSFLQTLFEMGEEEIIAYFNKHSFDFDFETTHNSVTEWDDICHVLFFENIGIFEISSVQDNSIDLNRLGALYIDMIQKIIDYNFSQDDIRLFWETLLFRSLREALRRVWYSKIMPYYYKKRYGLEGSMYYFELAFFASVQLSNYPFLQDFLNHYCKLSNLIFKGIQNPTQTHKFNPISCLLNLNDHSYSEKGITLDAINEKMDLIFSMVKSIAKNLEEEKVIESHLKYLELKPNVFGIGLNLNKLIVDILKKLKKIPNQTKST